MLRERGYPDTGDESDARKRLADALELELEALYFPDKTGAGVTTDINHRIQASMQVIERSETREVQFGGIFGPGDSHGDLVRLRIHPDGELIWTTLAPFSKGMYDSSPLISDQPWPGRSTTKSRLASPVYTPSGLIRI